MLVLSRKKNESIVINSDITVTVVEIRGDKVRLGIVAPKEVPVHRQEVYEAINASTQESELEAKTSKSQRHSEKNGVGQKTPVEGPLPSDPSITIEPSESSKRTV